MHEVLGAVTTEITGIAPPGLRAGPTTCACVWWSARPCRGFWSKYFAYVSGAAPRYPRLEPEINFDAGGWVVGGPNVVTDFEMRSAGYIYISSDGVYPFQMEANGARYLSVDGCRRLADASTGGDR